MTIDDLNQLQYLSKYIEHERDRLETMRESLDVKSPVVSDMPKTPGSSDRIGDTIPAIVDEAQRLERSISKHVELQKRLLKFIHEIPNVKIRLLITLRFIDGMSWNDVADYIDKGDGKCTADNVRMAVANYLKREEGHDK